MPEPGQLALDLRLPPPGILPRQVRDESHLWRCRGAR
jgi:hypothetical protein